MLKLFDALGHTPVGEFLRESTLAFALTESLHLIALSVIGGVVGTVGLSASGIMAQRDWARPLADSLRPLFLAALVAVAVSGLGLVAASPRKYYTNPVFWAKLELLAIAILAYALLDRHLARAGRDRWYWRGAALAVVAAWLSVAIAGRLIGLI